MKSILNGIFIITGILTIPFTSVHAQGRAVSGIVKDYKTGQPLEFCNIQIWQTDQGTVTDTAGKFNIVIPGNLVSPRLLVSYTGYKTDTVNMSDNMDYYPVLLSATQNLLNEIVISGIPGATSVRENPIPVISISPLAIEQTTESNIIDVLVKNVPGLNAVKTGPNISKPFIRGLGYNRVLTLFDGVRQEGQQWGDEHGLEVDSYNIFKAEVIEGPTSLMYGSDALAGVISLLPYMPHDLDNKIHGQLLSEFQHNNGLIGNGLRLAYSNQNWSCILSGSYRIAKNYSNRIDGRVYNSGFQEKNLSIGIQRKYKKGFSNLNATLYDNLQGIPDGSRDSLSREFTKQIYEGSSDILKARPVVTEKELNSYQLSPLHQHIQHYRIYSKNQFDIGKGDISLLLAFQQNIRREYDHPTLPGQAGMFVRLNTVNYGFRYNAPKILNIEISAGLNGMYQNNLNKNATDFPIPDYNLLDAGTFITGVWKNDRWTVIGGVRYDTRFLNGNNFYVRVNPETGFSRQISNSDTTGAYLQFPAFNQEFRGMSWSLGSTYNINDNTNLKANIARGYRAPNITEFASNGLDPGAHIVYLGNRSFVPEFSVQEDLGIETDYPDFSASLNVFNNNIDHYIYLSLLTDTNGNPIVSPQGNKTYQYQQSSAQLNGIESIIRIHPNFLKGFSFTNLLSLIFGYNQKSRI